MSHFALQETGQTGLAGGLDFWDRFGALLRWTEMNLPGMDTPQGMDVLQWLSTQGKPRPLKDLYGSSRFSEPTVRLALRAFVEGGFVTLERHPSDTRMQCLHPTLKFRRAMKEYHRRFCQCALLALQARVSFQTYPRFDGVALRPVPPLLDPIKTPESPQT